ncbi:MAG: hypothetical protein AAGF24_03320 [Cyanobacteria bacterium P01_H01_bin.121]
MIPNCLASQQSDQQSKPPPQAELTPDNLDLDDLNLGELLPTDWLISVGAIAVVVGLVSANAGFKVMTQLGQASEEILRGDRLPNLRFPINGS